MVSIAKSIEIIIETRPFLEEALMRGIINYTALAEDLKETIKADVNKEVTTSAIAMALRRYAEKFSSRFEHINKLNLHNSDITVRSDLFELTARKSPDDLKKLRLAYENINFQQGDFLTFTNGLFEITIISNQRYRSNIELMFNKEDIIKIIEEIAAITIKLPMEAIGDPGYFYVFSKLLAWKNISIVEIVSTLTELTLILFESDIPVAYNALKEFMKLESS
ncbi:MAG: hypothetical protein HeimC3_22010 [Candidatus Heimdallarchaeota archaeon LC_3]|nr:MAG: hypothetical protein HeimC3_22010 [Candidatus Heimdallarchaeota archaeon LC_3]